MPPTDATRLATLRAQFRSAGCTGDRLVEQTVDGQSLPNLVCTLPGTSPGIIVIGARLDFKSGGDNGTVQWATFAMLPLLAESMNSAAHRHTLVFAAFTGHDHDSAGATSFLAHLDEAQRNSILAMIDLDHLGRVPPSYAFPGPDTARMASVGRSAVLKETAHDETTLSKLLPVAARALRQLDEPGEANDIAVTDAHAFEQAGAMAITVHSHAFTVLNRYGGTPVRVSRTALDPQTFSDTYNLICVYTLFVDKALGAKPKPATQVAQASANPTATSAAPPATESASATPPVATQPAAVTPSQFATATSPPPALAASAPATPAEAANPAATFRSTTRLVQVDVVVTDKSGRPIEGLKEGDFTVLQDGKPQKLRVFEAHASPAVNTAATETPASAVKAPQVPTDTFSNYPASVSDQSWTIILYDMLNTPTRDQQNARKQLTRMLQSIPAGRPVALFVLTRYLQMVQSFTQDPKLLSSAANRIIPGDSQLLTTEAQRQQEIGSAGHLADEGMPGAIANTLGVSQSARLLQQMKNLDSFRTEERILFTLDAMNGLARAVSGYPGRKNLIWLSGSFPLNLDPDITAMEGNQFRNQQSYFELVRGTGALLTESRVAVYPIDIRGLQGRGMDISVSNPESGSFVGASDVAAGGAPHVNASGPSKAGSLMQDQASAYSDERSTLLEIAEQTGGRAFLNTNDFRAAVARSIDDGSNFYTLAYTPEKHDEKTSYHRIEVKLDRRDARLNYRRGYYSAPSRPASVQAGVAALRGALQPGMPPATSLYITAQVQPSDAANQKVRLQYLIRSNNVTFAETADHRKRVVLDFIAIAYDKEGREAAHASDTLDGVVPASAYEEVLARGLPAQQELSLPPGAYNVRLGVMDRATQQIGTVDVPLLVSATSAAK